MALFTTLALSGLTCAGGAAAAWWNRSRAGAEERRRLAATMIARVNERYKAYLELEDRMTRAIEVFDRTESRATQQVARLTSRILELEDELRSMPLVAEEPVAADPLSCLDDPFADPQPVSASSPADTLKAEVADALQMFDDPFAAPERDPEAELARLQGESKALAEQWATERAEFAQTIDELTAQVAELEPTSSELAERNADLTTLRAKHEELEVTHASEISGLLQRLEEFGPLLAERESELERWKHEHAKLQVEKDEEVASLRAEVARLETRDEDVESSELARERMRIVTLEARCHELAEENRDLRNVESYEHEILRQSAELEGLRARVDQRSGEVEALSLKVRELETHLAEKAELDKQCKSLERSVNRARRERDGFKREVADIEDQMRKRKLSPTKLASERKAQHEKMRACIDSLEPVAAAIEAESVRVKALVQYYAGVDSEKDAEIERLEECLSALHPICDSAEALMAMHAASKDQAHELEKRVNEARTALASQKEMHADLLVVIEELAPFIDEVNDQDRELRNWEEAFETLVSDKNAEIQELEDHIGALEPVCDAVEALVELLDEGIAEGLGKLSA
ncbi:MAG: hypothetical protein E2O39_09965 [Planctomycetota bacterium]|nr:MAG: hypothetical protein E2O39_09965 [Planctomycetota bacterium]